MPVRQRLDANDEVLPVFWTDTNIASLPEAVLYTDGTPPTRKGVLPAPPNDALFRIFTSLGWEELTGAGLSGDIRDTRMVYVDLVSGNDTNAAVSTGSDPANPYLTLQAAYNAVAAGAGEYNIHLGIGNHGTLVVNATLPNRIKFTGKGKGQTTITAITTSNQGPYTLNITSNKSLTITSILSKNDFGNSGDIVLNGVVAGTVASNNIAVFTAGAITATDCELGSTNSAGGFTGTANTTTLTDTRVSGAMGGSGPCGNAVLTRAMVSGALVAQITTIVSSELSTVNVSNLSMTGSRATTVSCAAATITDSFVTTITASGLVTVNHTEATNITGNASGVIVNNSHTNTISTQGAQGGFIAVTGSIVNGITASSTGLAAQNGGLVVVQDSVCGLITSTSASANGGNVTLTNSRTSATPILTGDGINGVVTSENSIIGSVWFGSGAGITNINASNLASGTVPAARGGAGTVNGLLKANGAGLVTAAVLGTDYLSSASIGVTIQGWSAVLDRIAGNTAGAVNMSNIDLTVGTCTVSGNVIINGNATINGTTTSVNSTVVNVTDRVVHYNYVSGIAPVPSAIVGFVAHRGSADGVTPRDCAGIFWQESTTTFKVALNTAGDDATLGAFLSLQALNLVATGQMLAADGTLANPGYGFSSSTGIGMRRNAGNLAFVTNSLDRIIITNTGDVTVTGGDFTATFLFGNGGGLTALNGSNITTGTVAAARLPAELLGLAGNTTNGFWSRSGIGTGNARTMTGTTNLIVVTNGDGASGDPTFTIGSSVLTATSSHTITNKSIETNANPFTIDGSPAVNGYTGSGSALVFDTVPTLSNPRFNGMRWNIATKTADYTAVSTDVTLLFDTAGASRTLTLPTAASSANMVLNVAKITADANTVTIDPNGAELISGAANFVITSQWEVITIQSNGTFWIII